MGAKKLKGRNDWSLRVRERRIVFLADSIRRVIYVTRIGNRGDVYKGG
jgi:mRNA-degrading endonuclease RelE of RelBE toxin-antitoxin system